MAELELRAAPPFAPAEVARQNAMVTLQAHCSIASIAVFKDCLAKLQDVLELQLPAPGRQIHAGAIRYLWAGPESWLAVADQDDPDFDVTLARRCDHLAAVTDQSDGRSILQISGPDVRHVLAKLLPIDLHLTAFPPEATAMTLAGHVPVQIWRAADNVFQLACFRSYAETLYEALIEASRI